jgi:hypothetical protein
MGDATVLLSIFLDKTDLPGQVREREHYIIAIIIIIEI